MAKVNINSFLVIEQSLTRRLLRKWRSIQAKILDDLVAIVRGESDKSVDDVLNAIDFSNLVEGEHKFIRFMSASSFLFGVGRLRDPRESKFSKDKNPIPHLDQSVKLYKQNIVEQGEVILKRSVTNAVTTLIQRREQNQDARVKAERVRSNREILDSLLRDKARSTFEIASSLHNSRLSSWGYIEEADALGITTYSISEQIESDSICPVCIEMHGKSFSVEEARQPVEQLVSVDNLQDTKGIVSFPPQNKDGLKELQGMDSAALSQRNWHFPPYHPFCRGLLVESGDDVNLQPIPPREAQGVSDDTGLFPDSLDELEQIEVVDSTHNRSLMKDSQGRTFEVFKGSSEKQVVNEFNALNAYRALGANTPQVKLIKEGQKLTQVKEVVSATPIAEALTQGFTVDKLKDQLEKQLVADSILGLKDFTEGLAVTAGGRLIRSRALNTFHYADNKFSAGAFTEHPLGLWSMRGKKFGSTGSEIAASTDFYSVMDKVDKLDEGAIASALNTLPDDLRDTVRRRIDSLKDVATAIKPVRADNLIVDYADDLGQHIVGLRAAGVTQRLPPSLTPQDSTPVGSLILEDSQGIPFDGLRARRQGDRLVPSDVLARIQTYINQNGGNYEFVENFLDGQRGASNSLASRALSFFVSKQRRGVSADKFYWPSQSFGGGEGLSGAEQAFNFMAGTDPELYTRSMKMYNAAIHEILRNIELPNLDKKAGLLTLFRKEAPDVLRDIGGFKQVGEVRKLRRQAIASTSLIRATFGFGLSSTQQTVPIHRIWAIYLLSRNSKSRLTGLYNDSENEFVADLYNVDVKLLEGGL